MVLGGRSLSIVYFSAIFFSFVSGSEVVTQKRNANSSLNGCKDFGVERKDLEVWKANGWQMQCRNGRASVTGCVASDRGNRLVITVNSSITVNGFWYNCTEANRTVRYAEEGSCLVDHREIHVNDTFRDGRFKRRCQLWGSDITGCYYDVADEPIKEIPVETEVLDGQYLHSCKRDQTGSVVYSMKTVRCLYNGKLYRKRESWQSKNFQYSCEEFGNFKITHCLSNDLKIPVGESLERNGIVHICSRVDNVVQYDTCQPSSNPNCTRQLNRPISSTTVLVTTTESNSNLDGFIPFRNLDWKPVVTGPSEQNVRFIQTSGQQVINVTTDRHF